MRAAHYQGLVREAGLEAGIDEIGNVVARRSGRTGGRTIAVVAHLDTVFPEGTDVTVRRDGDKLMAPGIADDTRGLVTMLAIIKLMARHGLDTRDDVLFVGSVGEEGIGDLRGVKHLFRDGGPEIDAFIAIDGTSNTRVLNHAIGSHRYRVRFLGPGGHSWGAFGLGNPAHAMARAIKLFDDRAGEYVTGGAKTTYNIGRIGGGTSINSIPFENWMEVDMRSMEPGRLDEIDAIFQAAMTRRARRTERNAAGRRGADGGHRVDRRSPVRDGCDRHPAHSAGSRRNPGRWGGAGTQHGFHGLERPHRPRNPGHHDRQRRGGFRRSLPPRVVGQP